VRPVPGPDDGFALPRPQVVAPRTLGDLAGRLAIMPRPDVPALASITGVAHRSSAVQAGDVYAALPGTHTHGARFAADAAARGAVAIMTDADGLAIAMAMLESEAESVGIPVLVVDDPRLVLGPTSSWIYGEPSTKIRVLGVTGTNGKTTTSYLLDAGLRAAGEQTGLIGTIETRVGSQVTASARTTPEAPDLQALFAVMAERDVGAASMEVSSHALALHRVDGTRFAAVAFTNLSQDHLDFHSDLDDYFAAKARLFTADFTGVGVVNVDDEHGRTLSERAAIPIVTVSANGGDATWSVRDLVAAAAGSQFVVTGPSGDTALRIKLPGLFNVANALLAFVTLIAAGVDPAAAATGIGRLGSVPGRMEAVDAGQPFAALVDYAHTPEAVETLLTTLRATTVGKLIVVLGCGGDRDRAKRPLMGAAAARLADVAVLTSDNPRSEEPTEIVAAMVEGTKSVASAQRADIIVELDRRSAIAAAVTRARHGDVVVVAGKGHEQGQEVAATVLPFDDRVVLRGCLADLVGGPS
jgi:UDP-N-acetylmuramoyl-L-alanyl-D-glutamate--2,6-diaminopimelate ligase